MKTLVDFLRTLIQAAAKRLLPHVIDRIVQMFSQMTGLKFEVLLLSAS